MNSPGNKNASISWKQILFLLAVIFASLLVFGFFLRFSRINGNFRASFADMLTGTASRPFVTRVLVPWLTVGTAALIPAEGQAAINTWISGSELINIVLDQYRAPEHLKVEALISIAWQYLSLLGFFLAFKRLLHRVFVISSQPASLLTIASSIGLLPLMFFGYLYDLPALFLCTLAFLAIAGRKSWLYFISITLAIINKETAIVLIIPSILLFWNPDQPRLSKVFRGLSAQIFLFLLVRVPLGLYFHKNPGEVMEYHLKDHWTSLLQNPVYGIALVVLFICLLVLFGDRWRQKPALINLGLISGGILFLLFLIGGMPMEFRIFYEVIAVVLISIMQSLLARKKNPLTLNCLSTKGFIDSIKHLLAEKKLNSIDKPAPG